MSRPEETQQAVYLALTSDQDVMDLLSGAFAFPAVFSFDNVPHFEGAEHYPYIRFGHAAETPRDDKDTPGGDAVMQIDIFDRAGDTLRVKAVAKAVGNALHRKPMTIEDAHHVDTLVFSTTYDRDENGTDRALMQARVLYEDA